MSAILTFSRRGLAAAALAALLAGAGATALPAAAQADTDRDGLEHGVEASVGQNPATLDSDGDGLGDTAPGATAPVDTDGDGTGKRSTTAPTHSATTAEPTRHAGPPGRDDHADLAP